MNANTPKHLPSMTPEQLTQEIELAILNVKKAREEIEQAIASDTYRNTLARSIAISNLNKTIACYQYLKKVKAREDIKTQISQRQDSMKNYGLERLKLIARSHKIPSKGRSKEVLIDEILAVEFGKHFSVIPRTDK